MSFSPEQPPSSLPPAPVPSESVSVETERYRPLAPLAVTSLALAVGLALVLAGGAAIAMFSRTPLLLPPWLLLLAAGVVVLAWVARTQIANSEGTLSGQAATTWAMGLCLVLAPVYGAYYAATYFAVTIQAQDYSMKWLTLLSEGELEQAFWMTIPTGQRPTERQRSRDVLEIQHNQPDQVSPGPYTAFRRSELARLVSNGGKGAKIELVNLNNWGFEQGGYSVTATYRVSTRFAMFDVIVATQGITGSAAEQRKRLWHVDDKACGRAAEPLIKFTPEGAAFNAASEQGQAYLEALSRSLTEGGIEQAFLLSLGTGSRAVLQPMEKVVVQGLGTGLTPTSDPETLKILNLRRNWFAGGAVDTETGRFWTASGVRDSLLRQVRSLFIQGLARGGQPGVRWVPVPRTVPLYTELENDTCLLGYDFQIALAPEKPGELPHTVNAIAQLRFKKKDLTLELVGLERIDLINGRSVPTGSGPPS